MLIVKSKKIKMNKCIRCGKKHNNEKYCSKRCAGFITGKISGKVCQQRRKELGLDCYGQTREQKIKISKKVIESHKKNKTGFYNSSLQSELGKRAAEKNRKNKTGCFFDKRIQSMAGKISARLNKKNKKGLYGFSVKERKRYSLMGVEANRKNKTGFFDKELQSRRGSLTVELLRNHSKHSWNGVKFRSKSEMECAKKILNRPIEGINCNIPIQNYHIDFFPQKSDKMFIGCFVEYHPINNYFYPSETKKSYYNSRRKILDKYGFKNKKLIVITNLKEIKEDCVIKC
jgi:hypothetical protein